MFTPCQREDRRGATALAALSTLLHHHGLPLSPKAVRDIAGIRQADLDPVNFLFAARQCGFEALPLAGGFDDLPTLTLPAIAVLQDGRHLVLYEVDDNSATTGDPVTGLIRSTAREEFEADWTGDIFAVTPDEEGAPRRRALLEQLTPVRRVARLAGLAPFQPARLLFFATVPLLAYSPLLGFNLVMSLWMAAFPRGCSRCRANASLSGGIPLPWLGAVTYATLLFFPLSALLWAVSGAHAALVLRLARARAACYPCFAIALSAWTATALTGEVQIPFALGAGVLTWAALEYANRRADGLAAKARERIVADAVAPDTSRLVVYTRRHCPVCHYFKTLVKPALAEAYTIEERDAELLPISVPLFVLAGPQPRILPEMETDVMLDTLAAALEPAA